MLGPRWLLPHAGSGSPSVVTAYVNGPGLAGAAGRLGAEDVLCLMP